MSENTAQTLQPPEWPRPRGYSNGIVASGRQIFVAGQIGWDAQGRFASNRLADQVGQALANICAVLAQAGAGPEHVVRLTWYLTSREEYHAEIADIGAAYRAVMGKHYPVMSVVQVVALMEAEAKVEIEATAVIPGGRRRASRRHGGASGRSVAAMWRPPERIRHRPRAGRWPVLCRRPARRHRGSILDITKAVRRRHL